MVLDNAIVDNVCELYCRKVFPKGDILSLLRKTINYYKDCIVEHFSYRVS